MKEWFQGRSVDEHQDEPGLPWWVWVLLLAGAVVALASCGTLDGVCAVKPLGQDENGVAVFAYHCEPT